MSDETLTNNAVNTAPAGTAIDVVAAATAASEPQRQTKVRERIEQSRTPTRGALGVLLYPFRLLKVLYVWLLSLADTKWGPAALVFVGVGDGSFFPLPADPLLLAMCFAKRHKSIAYANLLVLASIGGGLSGWIIGNYFFDSIGVWTINLLGWQDAWFGTATSAETLKLTAEQIAALPNKDGVVFYPDGFFYQCKREFDNNALLFYIAGAVTPIPYNVTVMAGGALNVSIPALVVGTIIGRGMRFWAVAILAYFFGERVKPFIERYFEWIALAILVLIAVPFLIFKYVKF